VLRNGDGQEIVGTGSDHGTIMNDHRRKMKKYLESNGCSVKAGNILRERISDAGKYSIKVKINLSPRWTAFSERTVVETILESFPDTDPCGRRRADREQLSVLWIIDPLDGTTNYAHDDPSFSVSSASNVQATSSSALSMIHRDECSRRRRTGAFLNGKPSRYQGTMF